MNMHLKDDRNPSNKYKRDGAKYVCVKCKQKFFSKGDVEACFDGHDGSEATAKKEGEEKAS